jgi:hypothetical protein
MNKNIVVAEFPVNPPHPDRSAYLPQRKKLITDTFFTGNSHPAMFCAIQEIDSKPDDQPDYKPEMGKRGKDPDEIGAGKYAE